MEWRSIPIDEYHFKAGLYVHRANHGQFNSIWGREDAGPPGSWLLNLAPIIPPQQQQQVAKAYVSAFLEATLRDKKEYLPLFRDPRHCAGWLPDLVYINQFTDSTFWPIATFEEDLDVTSTTAPGAFIQATGFSVWREEELKHRDERLQGTNVLVLGWGSERDATYTIDFPEGFWPDWIRSEDLLTLSVSGSTEELPGSDEGDQTVEPTEREPSPPRFSLETEDNLGRTAALVSDEFANLAPPVRVRYLKSARLNEEQYLSNWEPILQVVEIPVARVLPEGADVKQVRRLHLRFGGNPGVVIVDDIGIRRPDSRSVP